MRIRSLTVLERENVRKFYLALSADDRRKRFCCTLADNIISKYVDRLDFSRDAVLAAFDEHAHIVGLAELVRGPEAGEMAFSVRPDRRGQKIGTMLMERLLARARMFGIRKVFVMFLSDNTPMRKMANRAGMPVRTVDGESYAERELPLLTAEELNRWMQEESLSHSGYFSTLGMERWSSLPDQAAGTEHEPEEFLASEP
jgi:GNAT superfamily N-acetyltransferase